MRIGDFAEAVSTYRLFFNGSITSCGRTRLHNTEVGGVPESSHLVDLGADVVYDNNAFPEVGLATRFAKRLGLLFIRELNKGHDHLQPLDWS